MHAFKVTISVVIIAAGVAISSLAAVSVPKNATTHLSELKLAINKHWPTLSTPSVIGGQIEKESCITLTHSRCWNSKVELKTSREYGFGLGQITTAYDKFGNVRFNKFQELKRQFATDLKGWHWDNRFDASYQMTTIVLMDRDLYHRVSPLTQYEVDRLSFMLSAYNGGLGGVLQDRKLCQGSKGCDPSRWAGNVANYSFKSRTKIKGYGEAAYDINRGYVDQILNKRRQKYIPYLE